MGMVLTATFTTVFLFVSIFLGCAKSEQWKRNTQSQNVEGDSPGLSSFLEHVLKAQDEINWIKKVVQQEKGANKEQCTQCNSEPVSSSDDLEKLNSDNNVFNIQAENIAGNDWSLGSSGDTYVPDFMYDAGTQTQFKSKSTGGRYKRRSSEVIYNDPKLKDIIKSNIDNLHMLKFPSEHIGDTEGLVQEDMNKADTKDDASVKRRGTGKDASTDEESNAEDVPADRTSGDSVMEAYFAEHGRKQASRGRSATEAHNRDVPVGVLEPLNEAALLKTVGEKSEQEHQRLQLEDADGLLKGVEVLAPIGSIDNQMTLNREKHLKESGKIKLPVAKIKTSKITSRASQILEHGLPQQIKLDLMNDPLYNKVDLRNAAQKMKNINGKSEKNLVVPLVADDHLLSSVNQYLANFDQKSVDLSKNVALESLGAKIFLDKKDTSSQKLPWNGRAPIPQSSPMSVKVDPSKISISNSNMAPNEKTLIRLTRSDHEEHEDASDDVAHAVSTALVESPVQGVDEFTATMEDIQKMSRDKRTIVKRPGAIWQETIGNDDLYGSEEGDIGQEESDSENEGKAAISYESEENDISDGVASEDDGTPSKPEEDDSSVEVEESNEEASDVNINGDMSDETMDAALDQTSAVRNKHLDDAARLKASFKFSAKYASPLNANSIQEAAGAEEASDTGESRLVRNQRASKPIHQGVEAPDSVISKGNKIKSDTCADNTDHLYSREVYSQDMNRLEIDGNNLEQRSREYDANDLGRGEFPEAAGFLKKTSSQMRGKRNQDQPSGTKLYSSRSLLSISEPRGNIQDVDSENENKVNHSSGKRSLSNEEAEAGFLSAPLDKIINRELHSGNLPPLIRVKRSVLETDTDREPVEKIAVDQEAVFEGDGNSATRRANGLRVDSKKDQSGGTSRVARDADSKKGTVAKGSGKSCHEVKDEWKNTVHSSKHPRRNQEDEDEKEYETANLVVGCKNVTKRSSEQEENGSEEEDQEEIQIEGGSLISPRLIQINKREDEDEYEYTSDQQDKDYDVVRRHVQHSFEKRHPSSKEGTQAARTKRAGQAARKDGYSARNEENRGDWESEQKVVNVIDKTSEDRHKRASNNDGAEEMCGKGNVVAGSRSLTNSNDFKNINVVNNNKNLLVNPNLKFPYENIPKMVNRVVESSPNIIPQSKNMKQHSPVIYLDSVAKQFPGSHNDKAFPGSADSGPGKLDEIRQVRLDETKLSAPPAYETDSKNSLTNNNGNSGIKNLLQSNVNEGASIQHPRCAENKCSSSTPCPRPNTSSPPCPHHTSSCGMMQQEGQSLQLAVESPNEAHHQPGRRSASCTAQMPCQPEASDEYKGELDDGKLGTEIVQAIFQQVDKTPCLKQNFGSGLSFRYQPSEIKETKQYNCKSQQMMHQIMQLIDQSVDEEVKSRSCSPLPCDLEEFITWLMKNESRAASSTEDPFLFQSSCQNACPSAAIARHSEPPKPEDIERRIALLDKLICEFNKLEKCEQEEVEPIHEYLAEQRMNLKSILQKSKSKPSNCSKKSASEKIPESDVEQQEHDVEQQRLVEETMDSVGLGPNAMQSSNIGDKFISGLSMLNAGSGLQSDAAGISVARRSADRDRGYHGWQRSIADSRTEGFQSHRAARDAEFDSSHAGYAYRERSLPDADSAGNDNWGSVEHERGLHDPKGTVKRSNHNYENYDEHRSIDTPPYMPSQKYQRLVARAAELKRRKRYTTRKKRASKRNYRGARYLKNRE